MTSAEHQGPPSLTELENRNVALKERSAELERQLAELNGEAGPATVENKPSAEFGVVALIDPLSNQGQRTVLASLIGSILGLKTKN